LDSRKQPSFLEHGHGGFDNLRTQHDFAVVGEWLVEGGL
jgi:hypothetical protein